MKPTKKVIYIEWIDAITNPNWMTKQETEDWTDNTDWIIRDVGWLIKETKKYIHIASGWKVADDFTEEQFVNHHKIPKGWIVKKKILTTF